MSIAATAIAEAPEKIILRIIFSSLVRFIVDPELIRRFCAQSGIYRVSCSERLGRNVYNRLTYINLINALRRMDPVVSLHITARTTAPPFYCAEGDNKHRHNVKTEVGGSLYEIIHPNPGWQWGSVEIQGTA